MTEADRRRVAGWLLLCAALLFVMVVVGGITRLTRSGLSIVEWQPLVGAIPPLSQADWEELFARYRQTPEYRLVNFDMDLEGFKRIFWWEYFHRLLGRLLGVVFLIPFLVFLLRRRLSARLAWALAGVFALGALQGGVGWWMVQSGLVDDPRVSPVRLAIHLGLALAIFACELWLALGLLRAGPAAPVARRGLALALPVIVFATALSGGLVAGLRAGSAYATFPLMNGHLVPPDIAVLEPWWRNLLSNMATVQFVHRAFFWLLAVLVPLTWWSLRASAHARLGHLLLAVFFAQASLGIATLLTGVPVPLAAAHQGGAVALFAVALLLAHRACAVPARSPAPQLSSS